MKDKNTILTPYFALFIAVLAISTSAIFVKLATSPAPITAMYRLLFTVLLMTPFSIQTVRQEIAHLSSNT